MTEVLAKPRSVDLVGIVVADVGAALLVVSFTALDWFRNASFSEIHHRLDHPRDVAGLASAYFGWLGWTLLGVAFVAATAAAVSDPAVRILRWAGVVAAAAGVVITFWAIKLTGTAAPSYWDYLSNQEAGFYVALAGFVLIGIGAVGYRKGTGSVTVRP